MSPRNIDLENQAKDENGAPTKRPSVDDHSSEPSAPERLPTKQPVRETWVENPFHENGKSSTSSVGQAAAEQNPMSENGGPSKKIKLDLEDANARAESERLLRAAEIEQKRRAIKLYPYVEPPKAPDGVVCDQPMTFYPTLEEFSNLQK